MSTGKLKSLLNWYWKALNHLRSRLGDTKHWSICHTLLWVHGKNVFITAPGAPSLSLKGWQKVKTSLAPPTPNPDLNHSILTNDEMNEVNKMTNNSGKKIEKIVQQLKPLRCCLIPIAVLTRFWHEPEDQTAYPFILWMARVHCKCFKWISNIIDFLWHFCWNSSLNSKFRLVHTITQFYP